MEKYQWWLWLGCVSFCLGVMFTSEFWMSKLCAVEHWLSEQCMLYFHLSQLRAYAPINLKLVEGGGSRQGMGWGSVCQIPFPRANHSSQLWKNFPTLGGTLLSVIPRLDARKTQGKQVEIRLCNFHFSALLHLQRYVFNNHSICVEYTVYTVYRITVNTEQNQQNL